MKAERETVDRLIAHFLADRIGATFDGHISGVTRAGLFIKLDETGADGFVPASTIGNDYYRYQEAEHALVGQSSGETHRLGDRVSIRLVEAAPVAGALRFELLSEGRASSRRALCAYWRCSSGSERASEGSRTKENEDEKEMTDVPDLLAKEKRDQSHPTQRPRDAATLILLDRAGSAPKVLMGRRHDRHKFMPGKFVFPGGRVEVYDGRMPASGALAPEIEARLLKHVQRPSAIKARALALAAIRETCEETGLVLGVRTPQAPAVPTEDWRAFADASVLPDLAGLHFIARAITPPGRSRRFDTRFFAADAQAIAHRIEGAVGPHGEFDDLVWVPLTEARDLDLPTITQVVLDELEQQTAAGLSADQAVPFYRMLRGKFTRVML